MNGLAALDSGRNWVVLPVPRAALLLCTRCRNKNQEFLIYVSSDNWKFLLFLLIQSFTITRVLTASVQSLLKKGKVSTNNAVLAEYQSSNLSGSLIIFPLMPNSTWRTWQTQAESRIQEFMNSCCFKDGIYNCSFPLHKSSHAVVQCSTSRKPRWRHEHLKPRYWQ